jgi:hypothetical protein
VELGVSLEGKNMFFGGQEEELKSKIIKKAEAN